MIEINRIKYPELNSIIRLHPNPEIILGHEIFWQEKRDGSNLGIYLNNDNGIELRSRNMDKASDDFYKVFNEIEESGKIRDLLISMHDDWNDEGVIFGELLVKGKSPTKTEFHKENEFIIFDIWSSKMGGLIPYILVYQHCHHFKLPIVELYGTSKHITLESLLEFRDKMLRVAENNGREGVVGKIFEKNIKYIYFKEKLDTPKLEKLPRVIENGRPILPPLPESEVLGALDKTFVDLGKENFMDVKIVMPLFAKYVSEECVKHNCDKPDGNLYRRYRDKLEALL